MSIFRKREKSLREEYLASINRQKGYKEEIAELSRSFFDELRNQNQIKTLQSKIADEENYQQFLLTEQKHPKPVPHTVIDNSNRVFAPKFGAKIGSENKVEANASAHLHLENKETAKNSRRRTSPEPAEPTKYSNAKTIIFLVVFGLVLVGVAALSIYLSTCNVNSTHSNAAAIFASTSE